MNQDFKQYLTLWGNFEEVKAGNRGETCKDAIFTFVKWSQISVKEKKSVTIEKENGETVVEYTYPNASPITDAHFFVTNFVSYADSAQITRYYVKGCFVKGELTNLADWVLSDELAIQINCAKAEKVKQDLIWQNLKDIFEGYECEGVIVVIPPNKIQELLGKQSQKSLPGGSE